MQTEAVNSLTKLLYAIGFCLLASVIFRLYFDYKKHKKESEERELDLYEHEIIERNKSESIDDVVKHANERNSGDNSSG